jgi:methionine synthase I (cobalamin-dependent)
MRSFEDVLAAGSVVTDGAWGTELGTHGLADGECPDLWNLRQPERVEQVARAYVEAGSRVILTNTFRANRIALEPLGLAAETATINRAGVKMSRRAAAGRARVFASIGPSGKMFFSGDVTAEALRAAVTEQAEALASAGADALVIETMSDLAEAAVALAAARETGLPVVVSMVFDSGRNRDRTITGATPEQAVSELAEAGADAIGANCGRGIAGYVEICRRMRAATKLPIWIKANAGLPELVDGRLVYRTTPEEFASYLPELIAAGADFVGGCCGAGPAFIRALSERRMACA